MRKVHIYTDASVCEVMDGWGQSVGAFVEKDNAGLVTRKQAFRLGIQQTHSAEAMAVLYAMQHVADMGNTDLTIKTDCQSIALQIERKYVADEAHEKAWALQEVIALTLLFGKFRIQWIPRTENIAHAVCSSEFRHFMFVPKMPQCDHEITTRCPKEIRKKIETAQVDRNGIPIIPSQKSAATIMSGKKSSRANLARGKRID